MHTTTSWSPWVVYYFNTVIVASVPDFLEKYVQQIGPKTPSLKLLPIPSMGTLQ
ncbi:unnamed protein product [Amoebophrya sp. A25]|nr:unnamed protein product [Amoebophrya sp. A25]|eukprot:GSA25T00022833001.1